MAVASTTEAQAIRHRRCPVCDGAEFDPFMVRESWRAVVCRGCGLPYMPEHPAAEVLDAQFDWEDSFRRERLERWAKRPLARLWTAAVLAIKPSRESRAVGLIRRYQRGGRMLDVGCGDGRLLAAAAAHGFDVTGVEPSAGMARKALRRVEAERIRVGRLEDFQWADGQFDLVVSVSYLEHEPAPRDALLRFHALLRPGGFTLHKTPNFDSWLRTMRGASWSGFRFPEHVQYFTPATAKRLIEATGFEWVDSHANRLGDNFWIVARKPLI